MGNDRTDIPGSGHIRSRHDKKGAPPPSPQGASYETHLPPEPERGPRSWWPLCLIVGIGGCGCLIVILLAFGIIGGAGWSLFQEPEPELEQAPEFREAPPAPSPAPEQPRPVEPPVIEDGLEDEPVPDIYQPGEDVAMEAALSYVEEPDWVARVDSHSDDWRHATVSVGPPASEFVYVVTLEWNSQSSYYDAVSIDDVDYPGTE